MSRNYDLAMQYKDTHLTVEMFRTIQDSINDACRHYILGRACITDKERLMASGDNLKILGNKFGYAKSSADKFVLYAKAIDYLQTVAPDLAKKILEGNIRLSMENTLLLSHKNTNEIFRISGLLSDKNVKVADIFPPRGSQTRKKSRPKQTAVPVKEKPATIKDTPTYDPDAPLSSLSYTIPSWVSAIEKVFMNVDLSTISVKARYRLRKELVVLADTAGVMLDILREEK